MKGIPEHVQVRNVYLGSVYLAGGCAGVRAELGSVKGEGGGKGGTLMRLLQVLWQAVLGSGYGYWNLLVFGIRRLNLA